MAYPLGKPYPESGKARVSYSLIGNKRRLGITHTKAVKAKISAKLKGRIVSVETKEKLRASRLGKSHSEQTKTKISIAKKGKLGYRHSAKSKLKMSVARHGFKMSEETKNKMSLIAKQRIGDKNPNWCGGLMQDRDYQNRRGLFKCNKRRAIKLMSNGSYTIEEWENLKKKYHYVCPKCKKKEPIIKLTQDHIIPLIKGGSHTIDNIQPLCKSCNSAKQAKIFKINPKGQYELCLQ